jgi:hypothetical protein
MMTKKRKESWVTKDAKRNALNPRLILGRKLVEGGYVSDPALPL